MIPEDRLKAAVLKAAEGETTLDWRSTGSSASPGTTSWRPSVTPVTGAGALAAPGGVSLARAVGTGPERQERSRSRKYPGLTHFTFLVEAVAPGQLPADFNAGRAGCSSGRTGTSLRPRFGSIIESFALLAMVSPLGSRR